MIRVLDPASAVVRPDQEVGATVYISDRLLVRGEQLWKQDDRVVGVLAGLGLGLRPPARFREKGIPRRERRTVDGLRLESPQVAGLELYVTAEQGAPAPDAWTVVQQIRTVAPDVAQSFELVHVLFATGGLSGIGKGGGYMPGIGLGPDEFAVPGYGGKAPVAVLINDPSRTAPRLTRPPVVVMPDTGIGDHAWFPDEAVVGVNPAPPASLGVKVVGSPVSDRGPGVTSRLTGDLDRLAGHGTFIAGIVRQTCPSARLQSHAIMSSDGLVAEDDALELLQDLLDAQVAALAAHDAASIIDVLTLSFGCYHEDAPEEDSDPSSVSASSLAAVLRDLGRAGVLVVAGAGNDATERPFYPAAFAGDPLAGSGGLPLVSVGSVNPDRNKVSLFSNGGSWVTTYRPGAAIVSTLPRRQNASSQASVEVAGVDTLAGEALTAVRRGEVPAPRDRATIDLDDYSGGFGVWSGTSFSAPVLAGQLAQSLVAQGTEETDLDALLKRGWTALVSVLHPRKLA